MEDIRVLIVKSASAGKLILRPMSLIGQFSRLVEKLSLALHLVEPPLTLVHASVLVVKSANPMSHSLHLVALVLTALLVSLDHVLSL